MRGEICSGGMQEQSNCVNQKASIVNTVFKQKISVLAKIGGRRTPLPPSTNCPCSLHKCQPCLFAGDIVKFGFTAGVLLVMHFFYREVKRFVVCTRGLAEYCIIMAEFWNELVLVKNPLSCFEKLKTLKTNFTFSLH